MARPPALTLDRVPPSTDVHSAHYLQVTLNGDPSARYPGNVNFSFAYVEGESLLMSLKNLAVSSGSACTSASLEPSYVLRALGMSEDLAHSSIRFGAASRPSSRGSSCIA